MITIILVLLAAVGVTFFLMKKGKIQDANNNNIPDAIEKPIEEVKEVVKKTAVKVKKVAETAEKVGKQIKAKSTTKRVSKGAK